MTRESELQAQQAASWNGVLGEYWVMRQERLDAMMAPIAAAALVLAAPGRGERVLDVGCGCGATTMMLAEAVGPDGHATGVDISAPMLGRARARSAGIANVDWILDDAARHEFSPAAFDLAFSRFGVMFFADPVAAFSNLRGGLRPGGRIAFACWRGFSENAWMHLPFQAVLPHVPPIARSAPEEPGPFAFADRGRVERILTAAGFAVPGFTPLDVTIDLADGEGLEAAVQRATEVGPARGALAGQPEDVLVRATDAVREALRPHVRGGSVALPGAIWLVSSTVQR